MNKHEDAKNETILQLGYKPYEVGEKVVTIVFIVAIISIIVLSWILGLSEKQMKQGAAWAILISGIVSYKYYKNKNKKWYEVYIGKIDND